MQYSIEVIDSGGGCTAELCRLTEARLREKVNSPGMLAVESLDSRVWEYIEPGISRLRVRPAPGNAATFRVIEAGFERRRERRSLRITARHVLADTMDELFAGSAVFVNYPPSALLERILEGSAFIAGESAYADPIPYVRFEYEPVFDCLRQLCDLTGGELRLNETTGAVHLDSPSSGGGRIIRYGVDLPAASRTLDTSRLANRVYGIGGGDPPLTLSGATQGGGMDFIEDPDSIAAYGVRTGVYRDVSIEDVNNLVLTPALDGEYVNGLCEDWTNLGAAVSRNTDPAYIIYGTSSQRVSTSGDGAGIEQDVSVSPGAVYSLSATVFVLSGAVRVRVVDGTTVYRRQEAVATPGLSTVRIEDWKPNGGTVTVQIIQEGGGAAVFYVDSVQVNAGAVVRAFVTGRGADLLYDLTASFLDTRRTPAMSYHVEMINRTGNSDTLISPAEPVTVIDPTLDLTVATRVMERDLDLLRPWRVSVRLDTPTRSLEDVLEAMRKAQENGARHARSLIAESVRAVEDGADGNSFANRSSRFTGEVHADDWDEFSWEAGTLRVGNAWYAISAGSVDGLDENSVSFVCFDRRSPTSLITTATLDEAESDDRILLFTVTVTASPELCTIHPAGIIG